MSYAQIYAIVDGNTDRVVYIGKANNPEQRFKSHLSDSKRRNTPLYQWLNTDAGKSAKLVVLASAITEDWQSLEKAMIAQYRENHTILNLAAGGNAPFVSREQRVINAHNTVMKRESNPFGKRVWLLKKQMNRFINDWKRDGRYDAFNPKIEQVKAKLRYAGWKNPQLFGEYMFL